MKRRTVLTGGIAAAVVVAGGGALAYQRGLFAGKPTPEAAAIDFASLLAEVRADYIAGRVVEHRGWVLSQHEFDTIDSRGADHAAAPKPAIG